MATGGRMAMPTDAAADPALTLAQWLSPQYPVGAFAYSHGLEYEIEAGGLRDGERLRAWLEDILRAGSGRSDALFLAAAYRAESAAAVSGIDAACRAFAPSKERLAEADLQGAAFCAVTARVWGHGVAGLAYPVAVGRAARLAGLPLRLTAEFFLQAFLSNLVSVGVRLIPLGQTEGQALIRDLTPLCAEIARDAQDGDLAALTATAFAADIASMRHETLYSRSFRT